jgi:filamentous hemagglutinin family protein
MGFNATRNSDRLQLPLAASALAIAAACCGASLSAWANPAGGVAIQGQATFTSNGSQLLVTTQNGAGLNHSAINWQSFSIPAGSSTYFQQPAASSTVINRVLTNNPSQIFGTLGSNGNVVLVNQSGITVGVGAVVDTAGFTASALRMSDPDALAGRLRFGDADSAGAALSVQGSILARRGDVVLLGNTVDTGRDALVQAPKGSTILAAGQQVDITGRGLEGIVMRVQAPANTALNLGALSGDAVGLFASSLHHSGDIQAHAVSTEGGKVVLKAVLAAQVDGSISASALSGTGGAVLISASQVGLGSAALVDVRGATGGGEALIGGGLHGQDARLNNAQQTTVASGARILADATMQGDGGTVVVWSDAASAVHGSLSAHGAGNAGNGGTLETSGHYLDVSGIAVNAAASGGRVGTWLLDPYDITIVNTAADALPAPVGNLASYSGTSNPSLLDVNTVNAALNGGTNVTVQTGGGGAGLGDITVAANISTSSTLHPTLTLNAAHSVVFDAGVSASGAGAALDVVVTAGSNIALGTFGSIGLSTGGGSVHMTSTGGGITGYGGSVVSTAGGNIFLSAANGSISLTSLDSSGRSASTGTAGSAGSISLSAGSQINVDTLWANGGSGTGTVVNGGNAGSISISAGTNCDCLTSIQNISALGGTSGYGGGVSGVSGGVQLALGHFFNATSISADTLTYTNTVYDVDFTNTSLALRSMVLSSAGNITANTTGLAQFAATSTGTGSVNLTNTGALNIAGITVADGDIRVDNTGALTTTGALRAAGSGMVSLTAHSPLTIGAGGINASGSISLTAATPSTLSNMVLNGTVQSSASSVSLTAYNNIAQNGFVSGAQGVSANSSNGLISFGFNGYSSGAPLAYADVSGAVRVPLIPASALVGNLFNPATVLDLLVARSDVGAMYTDNPFAPGRRSPDALLVEGQQCTP